MFETFFAFPVKCTILNLYDLYDLDQLIKTYSNVATELVTYSKYLYGFAALQLSK